MNEELHELLKEFNTKIILVVESDYSENELTNDVVRLRTEIDRRLKQYDKIALMIKRYNSLQVLMYELINIYEGLEDE